MKWLVDTMGMDELRERIFKERRFLIAATPYPEGIPPIVQERGDAPAGMGTSTATVIGPKAQTVELKGLDPFHSWELANVVRGRANGTVSAYAHCRLGDITADQLRGVAAIQREFDPDGRVLELRVTNRQNLVFRGLRDDQLRDLHARLVALDMATPGAELARDVVACPGADTCNLAVTQSRGLAADIDRALDEAGLAEVPGVRINISGCTNSCGQHHTADIGFFGFERRAHGRPAPGYQMLLGGRVGEMEIAFGEKATKLPAKARRRCGRAGGRPVQRRARGGRDVRRRGSHARAVPRPSASSSRSSTSSPNPTWHPTSTSTSTRPGPYEATVGDSECAT